MAFNDALFQLGMDLTRSSTAQKEDHGKVAHVVVAQKKSSIERASGRFAGTNAMLSGTPSMGTHVTIDVYGITGLDNLGHVEKTLTRCVEAASTTLQHLHLHPVPATGGVSGVAVLSDGHISFHSRPSAGYAVLDIATSSGSDTHRWVAAAKVAFGNCQIVTRVHNAGEAHKPTLGVNEGAILHAVMPRRRNPMSSRQVRVKAA